MRRHRSQKSLEESRPTGRSRLHCITARRPEEGHELYVGLGVHIPAEPFEEVEQTRAVLIFSRAADLQDIQTGIGYRPMWRVEPTGSPRSQTVFLTGTTMRGERADASTPRDGVVHYGHVGWTVGRATRVRTRKGIRETTR